MLPIHGATVPSVDERLFKEIKKSQKASTVGDVDLLVLHKGHRVLPENLLECRQRLLGLSEAGLQLVVDTRLGQLKVLPQTH